MGMSSRHITIVMGIFCSSRKRKHCHAGDRFLSDLPVYKGCTKTNLGLCWERRETITSTLALFQAGCSPLVYSLLCVSGEFALPTDHHLSTTEPFSCALGSELPRRSTTEKSSRPSLKLLLILRERGHAKNKQCQETGSKNSCWTKLFQPMKPSKDLYHLLDQRQCLICSPQHSSGFFGVTLDQVCPSIRLCRTQHAGKLAPFGAP